MHVTHVSMSWRLSDPLECHVIALASGKVAKKIHRHLSLIDRDEQMVVIKSRDWIDTYAAGGKLRCYCGKQHSLAALVEASGTCANTKVPSLRKGVMLFSNFSRLVSPVMISLRGCYNVSVKSFAPSIMLVKPRR